MEYVGRRVRKDLRGRGTFFGSVQAYSPATGSFKILYDCGDSEELGLSEVSPLLVSSEPLLPPLPEFSGRGAEQKPAKRRRIINEGKVGENSVVSYGISGDRSEDLNGCRGFNLDGEEGDHGRNLGKLHDFDLNEGLGLELHEGVDLNKGIVEEGAGAEKEMIDLNVDINQDFGNVNAERKVRWFDLNVELKEDEVCNLDEYDGKPGDHAGAKGGLISNTENSKEFQFKRGRDSVECGASGSAPRGRRGRKRTESSNSNITLATAETGSRRGGADLAEEKIRGSGEKSEQPVLLPPKVELPPSSGGLDLNGASAFEVFSVYAFLRSFSTLLFLSPFDLDDFVSCVKSKDSTLLFDSIHVSLLRALQMKLKSLSNEGSATASNCLRSLNWDLLDLITWPVFVVEYLLLHSPGYIPGLDRHDFEPLRTDYYEMSVSAKVEILRHLCDDVVEGEAFRSELNRRTLTTEQHMRDDSSRRRTVPVAVASTSSVTAEDASRVTDGNGDECCLCKMDGNLICCDGCPAAFHSRCVGVVSSLLPEGDWYCPECSFDKDKPWDKLGSSIRGAELLGSDPYGRLFYSSCNYLLVSESCNDKYSFWVYKRDELPTLIEALGSSPFLYEKVISAICKHWNVVHGFDRMRSDLVSRSYSTQSASHEKRLLLVGHPTSSEAPNKDEGFAEKRSDEKSTMTTYSSNIETETSRHVNIVLVTKKDGMKMENQLVSSEGSAEVSQAFTKTDTLKEGGLDCSRRGTQVSGDSDFPGNLVNAGDQFTTTSRCAEDNYLSSANCGYTLSTVHSTVIKSQVSLGAQYVNSYEFAQITSSVLLELTSKSSDKTSEDGTRSIEENVSVQRKLIFNRFAQFSWSNIRSWNVKSRKEKCGWCFYCKVPEDEMNCLFVMNDSILAVENFTSEVLDIGPRMNREKHLIDVICHIICIEDHLQGLLLGPWLNPSYSQLWRKSVLRAADLGSIKILLLQLESNLHHLAVSADWKKYVDSIATMGSASYKVRSSKRVFLKHGTNMTKGKCSKLEISQLPEAATGLRLFWWRGGKASRRLFNCKVLPRSLASNAGRQGGCKKILGIQYPDSGDNAKRTKYTAWRAAVETSGSVEQLALQVRELDAIIRWKDIGNTHFPSKLDKESRKSLKSFEKVIIRSKCCEGNVVRYLLDFGKRRYIPKIVMKHGSVLEDSSSERKKYWLEESHLPLHLLKAFEEKRIARSRKTISGEFHESSRVMKPFKEKGFSYLFSRAKILENHQCEHCKVDVDARDAVSCQYCKGFFHKIHAHESAGSSSAESTYTCHKCQNDKRVQVDARKGNTELPKCKKALEALKPLYSGKRRKIGKEEKQKHLKKIPRAPLVVPLRRSVRNAERISNLALQNSKVKRRKKRKHAKPKKDLFEILKLNKCIWQKKRTTVIRSYWLNGLRLLGRTDDKEVMEFRSKNLVLSGKVTDITDKPKCSLCNELEYTSKLNYVACEICGVWFHGDALDLTAEKIRHLIGFRCHNCLKKRPLICPLECPSGSKKAKLVVSVRNAETDCNVEDTGDYPGYGSGHRKSYSTDE